LEKKIFCAAINIHLFIYLLFRMVIIEGERGAAAAAGIETRAVRAAVVGSSRLEAEV
jgi:hypothetical protein